MSIVAMLPAGPQPYLWAAYLVATSVVLVRTGWWRPVPTPAPAELPLPADAPPRERLRAVPLLAVTGLLSFCAWVITQVIYVTIRNRPESFTATDLARLSVLSFALGWSVGIGLLLAGRGTRAIGYTVRNVPSGMLSGVLGLLMALPFVVGCLDVTLWAMHDRNPPKHELLQAMQDASSPWVKGLAILSAVVAAPLFEEMLFRGCVQGGLRRATRSPWLAILIASTLFASIHPVWTMAPIFVFSVLLGIVYERSRNLWATTVMHALFNAIAIVTSGVS